MAEQIESKARECCTISSNPIKDCLVLWFAERAAQDEKVTELLVEFLDFAESQRVEKKE